MSESILKDAVDALAREYPNIERSTLLAICKSQFKWALTQKSEATGMCKEASQAMVFVRDPDVFIDQMSEISRKARVTYKSGIDAIQSQKQD